MPKVKPLPTVTLSAGVVKRYGDKTQVSAFDGVTTLLTEMDALVAYLQVLGRLTEAAYKQTAGSKKAPDSAAMTAQARDGSWICTTTLSSPFRRAGACST